VIFWRFLAGCKIVNYDEMDGDRLRLPANRNCYRLSRVSWALLKLLVLTHLKICAILANMCPIQQRVLFVMTWDTFLFSSVHNSIP